MSGLRAITVVGTGLIGASAALAARRTGVAVRGWDPDPDVLRVAHEREAVEPSTTLADAVDGAELVLVAAPVAELPHVVREVLDLASATCVVTDVGSTKSAVCAAARGDARFIGGHPICGETRGPDRANAELFAGATWFLTPTAGTGPELLRVVHGFVTSLGARPIAIDAGAHDRLVAVTSHLPHALANVLLNQAGAARVDGHDPLQAAGGSLRDMTRMADESPDLGRHLPGQSRSGRRCAGGASPSHRAARGGADGRGRRPAGTLDRRGGDESAAHAGDGLRRPRGAPASSYPPAGPPGCARRHLPGARCRAERAGLRDGAPLD